MHSGWGRYECCLHSCVLLIRLIPRERILLAAIGGRLIEERICRDRKHDSGTGFVMEMPRPIFRVLQWDPSTLGSGSYFPCRCPAHWRMCIDYLDIGSVVRLPLSTYFSSSTRRKYKLSNNDIIQTFTRWCFHWTSGAGGALQKCWMGTQLRSTRPALRM